MLNETEGEYDVNVREILRAVYLGRGWPGWRGEQVIEPATYDQVMRELLTVRGSPGPESYSVLYDCGNREEETGSPQEYADRQDWMDRAMGSLGKAGEYLAKRAAFLLPLLWPFLGPYLGVGGLGSAVPLSVPLPFTAAAAATVLDPFTFARIPETENHLLMIETSRYLTNQAMLEELGAKLSECRRHSRAAERSEGMAARAPAVDREERFSGIQLAGVPALQHQRHREPARLRVR